MTNHMRDAFLRPSNATFQRISDEMTDGWVNIFMWLIIGVIVSSFSNGIYNYTYMYVGDIFIPELSGIMYGEQMSGKRLMFLVFSLATPLVFIPLNYFIWVIVSHVWGSMVAGGSPKSFENHAYTIGSAYLPTLLLSSFLMVIPCLGAILSMFVIFYSWFLYYLAIKNSQQISEAQSFASIVVIGVVNLTITITFASVLSLVTT